MLAADQHEQRVRRDPFRPPKPAKPPMTRCQDATASGRRDLAKEELPQLARSL